METAEQDKIDRRGVEAFVESTIRVVFPALQLSRQGIASAAWSLYISQMANLQVEILEHGHSSDLLEQHRKAVEQHGQVIKALLATTTVHEVDAVMGMFSEASQSFGEEWKPTTEVKG